ncbi:YegP family protein [Snuella lapsa]|uniref:YegP family protein n=1 Tax=Snuella lapsa TaxID=870481 RepID=A0ABP6Y8W6_9FLAO
MAKFEIYTDKKEEFRFRLKANNGQIILASQGYNTKAGCKKGIASVRLNAIIDGRFERLTSKGRNPYFNLKAYNGQVVGTSEFYNSVSAMENGITSVAKNAPEASIVDLTKE